MIYLLRSSDKLLLFNENTFSGKKSPFVASKKKYKTHNTTEFFCT